MYSISSILRQLVLKNDQTGNGTYGTYVQKKTK